MSPACLLVEEWAGLSQRLSSVPPRQCEGDLEVPGVLRRWVWWWREHSAIHLSLKKFSESAVTHTWDPEHRNDHMLTKEGAAMRRVQPPKHLILPEAPALFCPGVADWAGLL